MEQSTIDVFKRVVLMTVDILLFVDDENESVVPFVFIFFVKAIEISDESEHSETDVCEAERFFFNESIYFCTVLSKKLSKNTFKNSSLIQRKTMHTIPSEKKLMIIIDRKFNLHRF